MATTGEIKVYGTIITQARDGRVAYAQQIYDIEKKMFITDENWIDTQIPLITTDDIDKMLIEQNNKN